MLPLLGFIGVMVALLGLVFCTDRVDRWYQQRRRRVLTVAKPAPPFRTSHSQCVDCGSDDEPLSIDTRQCFTCFGVSHANG